MRCLKAAKEAAMDAAVAAVVVKVMVTKGFSLRETTCRYIVALTRYNVGFNGLKQTKKISPNSIPAQHSTAAVPARASIVATTWKPSVHLLLFNILFTGYFSQLMLSLCQLIPVLLWSEP